jgi:FlaA1/EpsC-like NDP-sugar epimerase
MDTKILINKLLSISRMRKRIFLLLLDSICAIFAVYLALCLRLDNLIHFDLFTMRQGLPSAIAILFLVPIFFLAGGYRMILRFGANSGLKIISKMLLWYSLPYMTVFSIFNISAIPRSIGILQPIMLWFLIVANRFTISNIINFYINTKIEIKNKVLIYGAGTAGRQLYRSLALSQDLIVLGFLDDDQNLWFGHIENHIVYPPKNIKDIIGKHAITDILIAIPSINNIKKQAILKMLSQYPIRVRSLPSVEQIATGKINFSALQDISITDLLGRTTVLPRSDLMSKNVTSKTVMVTGAGGSIGRKLCKQLLDLQPKNLILFEIHEFSLYKIERELKKNTYSITNILPILADIKDPLSVSKVLCEYNVDTIYHAAAYKHVPMVESNPFIGVQNNVFGTLNLVKLSMQYAVKNFVLISTDKAVRPTNIMGASKRICEMILQAKHAYNHTNMITSTIFTMVRFGNVLGSSGSVVPLFSEQIKAGGPVTITHPEIIRYFMTGEEAAQLVIQAGAISTGGEVMLLDMGEPVNIQSLAISMIHLSGLNIKNQANPQGDIEIVYTGLRAGEKLYEELLIDDNAMSTLHPKIMRAKEPFMEWSQLQSHLDKLYQLIQNHNYPELIKFLNLIVPEFSPKLPVSHESQIAELAD